MTLLLHAHASSFMCYQLVFDKKYATNYAVFLWLVKILDIQQGDSLPRYLLVRYGVV